MYKTFDKVFQLMKDSFPENEYRCYENQKNLIKNPLYKLITKMDSQGNLIGFIAAWDTKDFSFIEHFAVNSKLRSQGIGSKMLQNFIKNSLKPIVLEVEEPKNEISKKRILFYEKNGFLINNFKYFQMPLRENASPIPMNIMSYPTTLNKEDFENIKSKILKTVYCIKT